MPKVPLCPVCGAEHILKTDPRHGGNDLTECVKALRSQVEALVKDAGCAANGGVSQDVLDRFSSVESRLTSLEGLVGQKVCFTTFDEKVAELAGAHRSLEARVAFIDGKGSATLPENPPAPVTQTSEPVPPAL